MRISLSRAWRETYSSWAMPPIEFFAWNAASQRVAAKCGYLKEADLPRSAIKAGLVIDRVQYAAYRPH